MYPKYIVEHTFRSIFCSFIGFTLMIYMIGACSESVPDVNRVQTHYIKKSQLEGRWYARQTMVDRPPQFAYLFTGIEGGLEKIEWEIRENQLIARRTYEAVPMLDQQANSEGGELKGSPVAIFPIRQHFDIIRDFNTSTGEQSNVIREDFSLNPWYEREYMRIDWSRNLIDGPIDLSGLLFLDPYTNLPSTAQWVRDSDPSDEDRWQVNSDFIMVTGKYALFDGGYSCYMNYLNPSAGGSQCGAVEVKVRHAFVKVDPEEEAQFESKSYLDRQRLVDANKKPLTYTHLSVGADQSQMVEVACTSELLDSFEDEIDAQDCEELKWDHHGRFGYFRTERVAYDRRVGGGHDKARIYLANHHQIWEKTIDEQGNKIPMSERRVRPVIYYLNPHFPEDLKQTALKLAQDWNRAFIQAASLATRRSIEDLQQELELRSERSDSLAVYLQNKNGEEEGKNALFQVRDNQCSAEGIDQFIDLYPRYQDYVDEALDEAGESILPGRLTSLCSTLNYYSVADKVETPFVWQQMGDPRFSFIWWIHEDQPNGPLGYGPSSIDPESGRIVSGNAYVYGAAVDRYARSAADLVRAVNGNLCQEFGLPSGDISCAIEGDDFKAWYESSGGPKDGMPALSPAFMKRISQRLGMKSQHYNEGHSEEYNDDHSHKPTQSASWVVQDLKRRLSRPDPSDPLQNFVQQPIDQVRTRIEAIKADPQLRARMITPEMIDLLRPLTGESVDQAPSQELLDLALEAVLEPHKISERLQARQKFYQERNVFLPEGLDDSIIGEALSLKDKDPNEVYTLLRKEIFEAVMLHEIGHTVGLRHNFEASFDALNYQDEFWDIRQNYAEEDWEEQRLPEYRYASIMDYGSRFNSDTKGLGKYDYAAIAYVYAGYAQVFDEKSEIVPSLKQEIEMNDYSKIPELVGSHAAIQKRVYRPIQSLMQERVEGVLENTRQIVTDRAQSVKQFWIDKTVPYAFCSDEYRGDLRCRTWDEGSNHSEAVKAAIDRYWQFFFLDSYRRGRHEVGFLNRFFGKMDRLGEYLTYPWQFYVFYDQYDVDVKEDLLRASVMGLNFLNQLMGSPTPGSYCRSEGNNYYIPQGYFSSLNSAVCDLEIPYGIGRDMWIDFSNDYSYQINYIGTYYDKQNLIFNLFNNRTRFFRVVDDSDSRAFSINFYQGFKKGNLINAT